MPLESITNTVTLLCMVYIPQTKLDESFPAMEFNIDR